MLVLWNLPTFATIGFLDFWYVPPVAMVLLFALPVDAKRGEATLGAGDVQAGVEWNVLSWCSAAWPWPTCWPARA